MTEYTLNQPEHDDEYYHLVAEDGIIERGCWSLKALIESLKEGDTIVKGATIPTIPLDDGMGDELEYDVEEEWYKDDEYLLAMEAQAEYTERSRWY